MTIGTAIVGLILLIIVSAIIVSMVHAHRSGKHIGCEGCGGCSQGTASGAKCPSHIQGCSCAEQMLKDVEEKLG